MNIHSRLPRLAVLLLCLNVFISEAAENRTPRLEVNNETMRMRLIPRTPNQMAAFYEARGFPKFAINTIRDTCFITVGIRNKSKTIVWLDLASWHFSSADGEIHRLDRSYWKQVWKRQGLSQAHQSTFRWTLIPEQLDYRPQEREGGNIILPRTGKPFTLLADFRTGKDKRGSLIKVKFENMQCAEDPSP